MAYAAEELERGHGKALAAQGRAFPLGEH